MINRYKYLLLTAVSSLAMTSCGLLGSMSEGGQSGRLSASHGQILLIASLGKSEKEGMIESYKIDPGSLSTVKTGETYTPSPTFLTLDKSGKVLYVTNETKDDAMASAFSFNPTTGHLNLINSALVLADEPTYVSTNGGKVVTANYGSGTITMMNREKDGSLGQADWRIELGNKGESHPHAVVFSPDGKDLFVPDLGLDRVFHFNISSEVPPITIDDGGIRLPEGTGPRHIIYGKNRSTLYLIAEKSPKIFVLRQNGGALEVIQEVSAGSKSSGAHISVSPDGRFLYTSFRSGGDGIMIHSIGDDGKLTYVGFTPTGKHPRQFVISPDGRFLAVASRDNGSVVFYERDNEKGTLTTTGTSISCHKPVFLLWVNAR